MPQPPRGPFAKTLAFQRGLVEGAHGVLGLCLLLAVLPLLMTFGQGFAALPDPVKEVEFSSEIRESAAGSSEDRPAGSGQDECQSVPGGGDGSGQASALDLHPRAAARKSAHHSAIVSGDPGSEPGSWDGLPPPDPGTPGSGFRPPLPYFSGYPVFLLGDLPPPPA